MTPRGWSLDELALWCRWGRLEDRFADMCRPADFLWPHDADVLERGFHRIQSALTHPYRSVLAQGCLAAGLARRSEAPEWFLETLSRLIDPAEVGIEFSWREIGESCWGLLPLALAGGSCADIRWALVGVFARTDIPFGPGWLSIAADEKARKAVFTAASLFQKRSGRALYFFPLLPRTGVLQIYGASLALPVYLEAWGLNRSIKRPNLLATGGLDIEGRLVAVGRIKEKIALAHHGGFSAMVFPSSRKDFMQSADRVELLQVADLEEAQYFWEFYAPGVMQQMQNDLACLRKPQRLAANIHLLGEKTLQWGEFAAAYENCVDSVLDDLAMAESFTGRLEKMIEDPRLPLQRLCTLLGPLAETKVRRLSGRMPCIAFRLTQVQLTACGHCGDVAAAASWNDLSQELGKTVQKYPDGLQQIADFWNRQFIHYRHSRYEFRPELPETIRNVLMVLERQRELSFFSAADSVVPSLGKLYGSIAQKFGFCGPAFLHLTEESAGKAQSAFGSGTVPEFKNEWRRQFCYLVYAYLDAGQKKRRLKLLKAI